MLSKMSPATVSAIVLPEIPNDNGLDLIPDSWVRVMPNLYAQDGKGREAIAFIKIFNPNGQLTLFFSEASPLDANGKCLRNNSDPATWADVKLFGWSSGSNQLTYVKRSELLAMRSAPINLGGQGKLPPIPFERDASFRPKTYREAIEQQAAAHGVVSAQFGSTFGGQHEMGEEDCWFVPIEEITEDHPLYNALPPFMR